MRRLAGRASAARRARGRQGRQPAREARRGRRHRRADGRGAHRTRDERVRPRLWPQHHAERRRWRGARSTSPRSTKAIAARPRLCHRGPQGARPGADRGSAAPTSRSPIWKASPSAASSTTRARSRWRAAIRQALRIRTPSIHQRAINLSGGNQQKVVPQQMAVHRAEGADPRRADARHRRRRKIRDLRRSSTTWRRRARA